jgi:predicted MFS family arabinose efflux permease
MAGLPEKGAPNTMPSPQLSSAKALTAMSAFAMAGNTPLVVQPMIVGAMVDLLKLTERQAGLVASVELTGLTLGILAMIGAIGRVSRSSFAVLAVTAIVLANLATCFVSSFHWLLPLRFLSGVGAAAAFCISSAMASSSAKPEHNFAVVNAVCIAYSGLLTLVTPYLLQTFGLTGIMATISIITLSALLAIPWTRSPQGVIARKSLNNPLTAISLPVISLLTMMLLLYTGHGAIWAFQERIGVAAGLSEQSVGKWLGVSMLIWGVSGSLLARLLSLAIGRVWPQIISLGASCLAVLLLVFSSSPFSFAASSGLIAFSWFYGLPYQMGMLAARDPEGRAALAGTMMSTGGMAAGPALAAMMLVGASHRPIGIFAGVCYLAALCIAVPSARSLASPVKTQAA